MIFPTMSEIWIKHVQTAAKTGEHQPGNAARIVTDGSLGDMNNPQQKGPSCELGLGFFLLKGRFSLPMLPGMWSAPGTL